MDRNLQKLIVSIVIGIFRVIDYLRGSKTGKP